MSDTTSPSSNLDLALLIGRISVAPLFLISAYYKITQWPGIVTMLTNQGAPLPLFGGYVAVAAETLLPLMIIFGFKMRWACLGLALYVLGTNAVGHRFWEVTGGAQVGQVLSFFKNIALCGGLLVLAYVGPGKYAVQQKA